MVKKKPKHEQYTTQAGTDLEFLAKLVHFRIGAGASDERCATMLTAITYLRRSLIDVLSISGRNVDNIVAMSDELIDVGAADYYEAMTKVRNQFDEQRKVPVVRRESN